MFFLKLNYEGKVTSSHTKPFDTKDGLGKTQEQLEQEGVLVENIPPELPFVEGKKAVLYYNKTNGLYYKYEDIPKTKEQLLEERVAELENYILSIEGVI